MKGAQIDNNQCYFKNASLNGGNITGYTYNRVRQIVGDSTITTSATYANSSFTIFIRFNQKDGVTVADVNGSFNGTNLYEGAAAAKGSGTSEYDNNGDAIVSVIKPGTIESKFDQSDLIGSGILSGNTTDYGYKLDADPTKGVYYVGVTSMELGDYSGATAIYKNGEFPPTVSPGDVFVLGDYEYRYNYAFERSLVAELIDSSNKWFSHSDFIKRSIERYAQTFNFTDGWGARVLVNKSQYAAPLETINGMPVAALTYTYSGTIIATPPEVPSLVTVMCTTYGYTPIKYLPNISRCNSLTSIRGIFNKCENLKVSAKNFNIPSTVTDMCSTFQQSAITEAPIIPSGVRHLDKTFLHCKNLGGEVEINATKPVYNMCFFGTTKPITLYGNCPLSYLNKLAASDKYTDLSTKDNVRVEN